MRAVAILVLFVATFVSADTNLGKPVSADLKAAPNVRTLMANGVGNRANAVGRACGIGDGTRTLGQISNGGLFCQAGSTYGECVDGNWLLNTLQCYNGQRCVQKDYTYVDCA